MRKPRVILRPWSFSLEECMVLLTHQLHHANQLNRPVASPPPDATTLLLQVLDRLTRLEEAVGQFAEQQTVKEWYGTEELAKLLGKAEFTVREWCRLGRVHAEKRHSGRGKFQAWVVSHEELQRIRREGLLPVVRG